MLRRTGTIVPIVGRADLSSLFVLGEGKRKVVAAAAWLVWQHRRQLVAAGRVDFHMPAGHAEAPAWFDASIEVLRLHRPESWRVVEMSAVGGKRRWRLFWRRWHGGRRKA